MKGLPRGGTQVQGLRDFIECCQLYGVRSALWVFTGWRVWK